MSKKFEGLTKRDLSECIGNIPDELKSEPRWVVYTVYWEASKEKWRKVPVYETGGSFRMYSDKKEPLPTDRVLTIDTCLSFRDARVFLNKNYTSVTYGQTIELHGLGFYMTGSDFSVIDIDDCLDSKGNYNSAVKELVDMHTPTFIEKSVSQTGLHIWYRGKSPRPYNKNGKKEEQYKYFMPNGDGCRGEWYDGAANRFIAVTGYYMGGYAGVNAQSDRAYQKYFDYFNPSVAETVVTPVVKAPIAAKTGLGVLQNRPQVENTSNGLSNEEVIRRFNNGKMPPWLMEYWNTVYVKGKIDGSKIEYALADQIAFFVQRDPQRTHDIFIQSPYYSTRKDDLNKGELIRTCENACEKSNKTYTGLTSDFSNGENANVADDEYVPDDETLEEILSGVPALSTKANSEAHDNPGDDKQDNNPEPCEQSVNGLHRRLTRQQMRNQPKLPMLLEDNFARGQVGMLVGQSQSRKTFMIIQMMYDAMLGRKFLNKFQFNGNLKVLYNPGEDSTSINTRLSAIELGLTEEELAIVDEKFLLDDSVVQLADDINVIDFIHFNRDQNIDIVVIDTFARATIGEEENSNTAMSKALSNATKIAKELNCYVLLVHHMKKGVDEIRGASSITGHLDQIYYMNWTGHKGKIWAVKTKNQGEWRDIHFTQEIVVLPDGSDSLILHIEGKQSNTPVEPTGTNEDQLSRTLSRMNKFQIIIEYAKTHDKQFTFEDVHAWYPTLSKDTYKNAFANAKFTEHLSMYLDKFEGKPNKFRIKEGLFQKIDIA